MSKLKLSTLIDNLLPPKRPKKVVGKKRFATKDKLRVEPALQKRQAVAANSQDKKIAKIKKVVTEKIDSSSSQEEKKNSTDG